MEKEDEIKPMITENSVEVVIKKEEYESNPWLVDSVSELLKYCCPECNYSEKDLKLFSSHAQENHERSSSLINDVNKMIPKNEHDTVKEGRKKEEIFEDNENSGNDDVFNADSDPDFAIGKTDFKKKGNKRKIKSIKRLPSYDDSDFQAESENEVRVTKRAKKQRKKQMNSEGECIFTIATIVMKKFKIERTCIHIMKNILIQTECFHANNVKRLILP